MADKKQIMSWLEGLTFDDWHMFHSDSEVQEIAKAALALMEEQEVVVHCGECENFCFDSIFSPNVGRCILTNKSHSKTWFCAHGKRGEGR